MSAHTIVVPFIASAALLAAIAAPAILRAGQNGPSENGREKTAAQSPSHQLAAKPAAPYAGQQIRAIKALSEKEINGLLNGAGLGFAKAAELNHYPGPVHVIALAQQIGLTPDQLARTKSLYQQMKRQAVPLGEKILAREKHLDSLFASRTVDEDSLQAATGEIGRLRGSLRAVHLRYHLKMKILLTPRQVADYDRLRGYGPGSAGGNMDHNKHGGQQH